MAGLTSPVEGLSPEAYARARDYQMYLMREFALTPEQASGYVGNLIVESDKFNIWNPGARTNPTSPQTIENAYWGTQYGFNQGDRNSGIGDAQYTNVPRHNAFIDYVNKHRMLSDWTKHASDFDINAGFMGQQLQNEEKKNLYAVRQTSNPEDAGKAAIGYFRPSGYERGAENALHYQDRIGWSRKLYDALPNQFNDWGGWKEQQRYLDAPWLKQGGYKVDNPTFDYKITASPNDPDPYGVGRIIPQTYGSDTSVQDLGPALVSLSQQYPNMQFNTAVSGDKPGLPLIYWQDNDAKYHTFVPWAKPDYGAADAVVQQAAADPYGRAGNIWGYGAEAYGPSSSVYGSDPSIYAGGQYPDVANMVSSANYALSQFGAANAKAAADNAAGQQSVQTNLVDPFMGQPQSNASSQQVQQNNQSMLNTTISSLNPSNIFNYDPWAVQGAINPIVNGAYYN